MTAVRIRPLGLRAARFRQWLVVVRAERLPWSVWWAMARLLFLHTWRVLVRGERPRPRAQDYRRCVRCPLHDPEKRACGLCGCFMPYKLAAGGGCTARERDPGSPLGF